MPGKDRAHFLTLEIENLCTNISKSEVAKFLENNIEGDIVDGTPYYFLLSYFANFRPKSFAEKLIIQVYTRIDL